MQALRYHGNRDLRLEKLPIENDGAIPAGHVKIRNAWNGICGSDVHEYTHGPIFPPPPERPHPLTGTHLPIIFGHEFSGTVEAVGPGETCLRPGMRVAVEGLITDETCYSCKSGKRNVCEQKAFLGLQGGPGGLAEYSVIPHYMCHVLPENVSLEEGALAEPLSVSYHAVRASGIKMGKSALVLGLGPIGLGIVLCLQAYGVSDIIVSEPSKLRRAQGLAFGATIAVNPTDEDVVAVAKEHVNNIGPHVAFDASGLQETATAAIHSVRSSGTAYNVALWSKPASINPNDLLFFNKKYMSDISYGPGDYDAVIEAMASGRLKAKAMITSSIDLEETIEKGIMALEHDREKQIKILVRIDKSL